MPAFSPRFFAVSWVFPTLFLARPAYAQHCAPTLDKAPPLGASLGLVAASYRTPRYEGKWEEARLGLAGSWAPLSVRVWVPAYRLERNGLDVAGLGDVGLSASAMFWEAESKTYSGGLELAITLPTGAPEKDLGMGHPMVMSGPFASLRLGRWVLGAELTLATALTRGHAGVHAAHQHGPAPIVAPMNRSEAEASTLVRFELSGRWRVEASASGALPLEEGGEPRLFGGLGPSIALGPVDLQLRVELPIYGDAFLLRTSFTVGWAFGA